MLRAALLLAFAPALVYACTASEVCTTASDWDPNGTGGDMCCEDASCAAFNYNEIDPTCTGCVGTPYSTQATCTGAGKFWFPTTCAQMAPNYAGICNQMEAGALAIGYSCCPPPSPPPASVASTSDDPCFPSSAVVTKADGSKVSVNTLREGDAIAAVTANGELTTDTVSLLSIVKPEVAATDFLVLTATADKAHLVNLTVTAAHHVPVGAACCSSLKQAGEVEIGETIYTIKNGVAAPSTVTKVAKAVKAGLHSPVLTNGHFPVIDDTVTAFDSATKMHLASYALPILEPACKATGTCASLKKLVGKITGRKY